MLEASSALSVALYKRFLFFKLLILIVLFFNFKGWHGRCSYIGKEDNRWNW